MSQRNNPELRKEWERRIALFRASGLTQSKWCEINEISIHQLKYWLYKADNFYSTQDSNSKWIPVTLEESEQQNETLHINVGSASIVVKPGFNPTLLAEVVKALKSVC
ncbi:IS66 family insertion sequence element accessory protein TnpB [Heyndrickxia sporothermodurans]|uniref:IS66 family insertion sequence element accessory protein TnpB n=2 Tax=Heyndrickxia sporothermodurans TaxID=46224 RepID=A0AB37H7J4_9BACI|nr:hypothetical protein [Heyndrickxia sporothermodurans]MED1711790.1 IS66 family insertion sequence element accessory protein TnpB [Bacillus thuringiensis]HAJ4014866.1 IS66 family insertion sequence element accessory protein TnpB [Escherichia coli]MBL5767200.1 IS66 family insertion sequence element accessory protein TnpB [Heyndrickxia sporothermodurans]MBL5770699.1 IS66 family insertion sequence element accessory protein TnpB [Heyndrickxia sporothermodurans]MBL5773926.1 IS66 family insertion s